MKQDRNGVRTAQDLERKYELADLIGIKKAVELQEEGINKTNATLEQFMSSTLGSIDELQQQLDGSITTYYCSGVPTLDNYPANEWTVEDYPIHVGNMYYDKDTGYAYRFFLDGDTYTWVKIADSDVEEALRLASQAQDTADGKRRVFTTTPFVPYDEGDLWLYAKDLYVCKTSKTATETYNGTDWEVATKYTDDSALNNFVNNVYPDDLAELTNQIDSKITTWYYSGEPTLENTPANTWVAADYIKHTGDLYYDKETGYTYTFQAVEGVYEWVRIVDEDLADALSIANAAQDTADNKRRIFLDTPEPPYDNGDLWLNNEEIYVCQIGKPEGELYAEGDFIVGVKYTDDTLANEVANELTVVKGQVTTIIEDNNEIKVTFTETTNLVNELTNEVADEIATRSAMIRATSEDGLPVIELGSTESPVQTKYKNDGMYIEENGATTSYFKNGKAYNYDMEVLHALTIGRFAFKPRKNGNLSLVYIGEGGDE